MPKNKRNSNPKSYYFTILVYPEWHCLNDILNKITQFKYAYILHDKDIEEQTGELKKPHYHIVLKLNGNREKNYLINLLCNDELTPNLIDTCDFRTMIRYLIHIDYPQKYQYPKEAIQTNIIKLVNTCFIDELEPTEQLYQLMNYISLYEGVCESQTLIKYAIEHNLYKGFKQNQYALFRILTEHNSRINNDINNTIKVIANNQTLTKTNKQLRDEKKQLINITDTFGFATFEANGNKYTITKNEHKKNEKKTTNIKRDSQIKLDD